MKIGPRKAILFLQASSKLLRQLCHKTAWHLKAAERAVSLSTTPRSAALAAFFYCAGLPILWCFKARMTPASSVLRCGTTWPFCWHPWVIMPPPPPAYRNGNACQLLLGISYPVVVKTYWNLLFIFWQAWIHEVSCLFFLWHFRVAEMNSWRTTFVSGLNKFVAVRISNVCALK